MASIPADPDVCVVIPAYNTATFIADTLDSVFAQTLLPKEVIVVNDGSPDTPDLEAVLSQYMDRIRYVKRDNGGLAAARNTGIRATSRELVAIVDSDDIWEPDYLTHQAGYLRDHPEFDLVYGDATIMGSDLSGRRFMEFNPSSGDVTFSNLASRKCNVMVSALFKRQCLVSAGLFDETLRRCEDLDMWARFLKAGYRIGYHTRVVMKYRRRDQSLSADALAMFQTLVHVYESFAVKLPLSIEEKKIVSSQLDQYRGEVLFLEGKAAFIQGDFPRCLEKFSAANEIRKEFRLQMITKLVAIWPSFLRRLYLARHRR